MNAKTGKAWSEVDLFDFGNSLGSGDTGTGCRVSLPRC